MRGTDSFLNDYIIHLADNSLILGQRNSEWCGHGPVLEQDIALTNISLDLIGESRSLYQYAASLSGEEKTEDDLAFLRDGHDFKNLLICEHPNNDWAYTIARQFFFDAYHFPLQEQLCRSGDEQLAAIASKTLKESAYHLKWSSEWMIRLGDGTSLSKQKIQQAVNDLWEYTGEMFILSDYEIKAKENGTGADLIPVKKYWEKRVSEVMNQAGLSTPEDTYMHRGGKSGIHTEHLGFMLAEMQFMQRTYPNSTW